MTRCGGGPTGSSEEEILLGGTANRGLVVRVGDTVRRPVRPATAATHALLRHLEAVGFEGAPRVLGTDSRGREVLSWVEGSTVIPPYPAWGLADEALDSVALLLRDYHDATAGFPGSDHSWSVEVPAGFRAGDVVSHNDPNLDNIVFRCGRAVALLDFDLAAPGSRVWDLACAARLWAPLRLDQDVGDARRGRALTRFRRVVDAYGLDETARHRLVDALLVTHDWCYDIVRLGVAAGHASFSTYWAAGGAVRADRTRAWYVRAERTLRDALL